LLQNGQDAAASPTAGDPGKPGAKPAHGTELALHTRTVPGTRAHTRRGAPPHRTTPLPDPTTDGGTAPSGRESSGSRTALLIRAADAAAEAGRSLPGDPVLSGSHGSHRSHRDTALVETTSPSEEVVDREAPPTTDTPVPTPAPPTTTSPQPPPVSSPSGASYDGEGQVTYYEHPAGTCASPWLPFGTVVEVTNPANGESVSCVVNDREADTSRSIDLATATFAEIAPLSQGVINAELSW
jgi:hypothetical protein